MSPEERGLFMEEKALRVPRRKLWGREGFCHEMKSILKTIGEVSLEIRDKMIERPQEIANTYPLAFTISASK
jgi:hypothetical protein